MPHNSSTATPTTSATLVIAAGARQTLRLTNTGDRSTVYVNQNAATTATTAGNRVLRPGESCLVENPSAASAAWYAAIDAANGISTPQVTADAYN